MIRGGDIITNVSSWLASVQGKGRVGRASVLVRSSHLVPRIVDDTCRRPRWEWWAITNARRIQLTSHPAGECWAAISSVYLGHLSRNVAKVEKKKKKEKKDSEKGKGQGKEGSGREGKDTTYNVPGLLSASACCRKSSPQRFVT